MSKEIYISSTPHETRLAIVENDGLTEIYYERENEYTLAGSIYNGKVTRVLPGMQSAFVDIGLERDAFLYVTDFMEEADDSAEFEGEGGSRRPSGEGRGEGRSEGRGRGRGRGERRRAGDGEASAAPAEETEEGVEAAEPQAEGEQETGEGGSRRWRGRRGRRRGRGPREEGTAPATESQKVAGEGEYAEPVLRGEGDDEAEETELYAFEANTEEAEEAPREEGRRDRGGCDRGGRGGREQGRGGRDRERSGGRRPRYGEYSAGETSQDDAPEPTGEKILLPGELLAKYRSPEEVAAEDAAREAAKPKTEVIQVSSSKPSYEVVGWDGGLVLPGETIRPRGPRPEGEESEPREARGEREGRRDGGRGRGRNDRRGGRDRGGRREDRPRRDEERTEASLQPTSDTRNYEAEAQPTAPVYLPEVAEEETFFEETPLAESFAAVKHPKADVQQLEEPPVSQLATPAVEEHVEFEPKEGDTARQAEAAPKSSFWRWRERRAADKAKREAEKNAEATPSHEMTTVQPTGEMLSIPEPPAETLGNPAAPVEHETAVQSVTVSQAETLPKPVFAGYEAGTVEEEEAEDEVEESSTSHLYAFSEEDVDDDLEEETMEGTSHLYATEPTSGYEEEGEGEFTEESSDSEERDETLVPPSAPLDGRPRREGRGGGRDRRGGRRSGGGGERHGGGRGRRPSVQTQDLPAINELLKPGQEILVQIAKEPIAKKGARITSHIALPGRFLVFMPTVNHTGVSRKISSDEERRRLKSILLSEKGDATGGFIVRTAAEGASEEELRNDLRFLINLWTDIKSRSEASKSPALIYHDLNLVERILRDQVTDNFSAIWVDTEADYERILRFLQRFQPSLIRRVKLYTKDTPLFEQFGITPEIDKALQSKVWLKSGGSIVINQTEALVAIDINTGKYVGKTARLEDTIVKTNLDAIPEIVRQIRLRDLGGIIVIDFIDMDDRKNRQKVLIALEEELKNDRAPSKVLQFNDFGLVAITRKRVRQSLERTLSTPCAVCTGTGMVKSPVTVANEIYIEMRKMYHGIAKGDLMLRVHPEVVKQLKLNNSRWLLDMEEMTKKTILVKSDPSLGPDQFDIH